MVIYGRCKRVSGIWEKMPRCLPRYYFIWNPGYLCLPNFFAILIIQRGLSSVQVMIVRQHGGEKASSDNWNQKLTKWPDVWRKQQMSNVLILASNPTLVRWQIYKNMFTSFFIFNWLGCFDSSLVVCAANSSHLWLDGYLFISLLCPSGIWGIRCTTSFDSIVILPSRWFIL